LLVALSACAGVALGSGSSARQAETPGPRILTFAMLPQSASGAEGHGRIAMSSNSFTVTLTVSGLVPNTSHLAHIHKGDCSVIGAVAVALSNVVADASGNATAVTSLDDFPYATPSGGWYAMVHAGPDLTGTNARGILCGNLPAA
jgi:hypothetical protein